MQVWQAVILGLVQGVTEFLPVSSSGHLVLLQTITGWNEGGLFWEVALHFGTLLAILIAFRREIVSLFRPPFRKLGWLIVASLPSAIIGLVWGDEIERLFCDGRFLPYGFALSGVGLCVAHWIGRKKVGLPLSGKTAFVMGVAQAAALLPGISRSGATLTAGLLCGADREEAASFSLLMSLPVVAGGCLLQIISLAKGETGMTVDGWCVGVGVATAAIAGWASARWVLSIVKRGKLWYFSVYLFLLSAVLFVLQ